MNELNIVYIKQDLQHKDVGTNLMIMLEGIEKFAELIVRECAEIAETAEPYQSCDIILRHFGVK